MKIQGACAECGEPFTAHRANALFCSTHCRQAFNNRRRDRGAEFYDAYMGANNVDEVRKLKRAYLDADKERRDGRPSWQPWRIAKRSLPIAYGKEGDKR